jgi:hypothetical protein
MTSRKTPNGLGMAAALALAILALTALAPSDASARHRIRGHLLGEAGWAAADFCGGRLPAYGFDACGNREFSYGPNSCWRRTVAYTSLGPVARRVWRCR